MNIFFTVLLFISLNAFSERLYNGIQLPSDWPPEQLDAASTDPMPVPYLECPPEIIPIDVGRQLFVDDFLIEQTSLVRTFHYPKKYHGNPVLKPKNSLEWTEGSGRGVAAPLSGAVLWDEEEQVFKLWYNAGWHGTICYATSKDGIEWARPKLDIVPDTNQVYPADLRPDSTTVVRDWWTENSAGKYKLFVREPGGLGGKGGRCFESPDGIHFGNSVLTGNMGDRSTIFYNPFRKKWVFSIRSAFRGRSRHYWESEDLMADNQWELDEENYRQGRWSPGQPVVWAGADALDLPDADIGLKPQLYNLDAVAYESIMLGFFQIWRGPNNNDCHGVPKVTELNFAYSRDGFHWDRPDRTTAIEASRTAGVWDRGYIQSVGGICTVRGDQLWFYYSGMEGDESIPKGMYANGATGIAVLRRDGFASMKTPDDKGSLITRPVLFSGKHLFVNADVPEGTLKVEMLDVDGNSIPPFVLENSHVFTGDSTVYEMTWDDGADLSVLAGKPVRFRFVLERGDLYSFWVSCDRTGRSDGYVAAGGPGFKDPKDTVGAASLVAEQKIR
ncbi:glycosyl hydrolase family 32 [Tichowtungia aerotolerans]|uniref:Glycosyl hydrolase family 32 n=1 Tax=Tichowtungia aerotolerans TaxID=2697043 RepID=A0A6P1M9M0_9BACT|nr:glycosyl hydrolase family 32 [Tichowtungia aerotolerans]QHI70722.1 glycosyl hydrolase family 32 [Tichowtungia aerotolerans]